METGHLRLIRHSIRLSYLVGSSISNYRLMRQSDLGIIKRQVHPLKGLSNPSSSFILSPRRVLMWCHPIRNSYRYLRTYHPFSFQIKLYYKSNQRYIEPQISKSRKTTLYVKTSVGSCSFSHMEVNRSEGDIVSCHCRAFCYFKVI
jgi:hypothetical protein